MTGMSDCGMKKHSSSAERQSTIAAQADCGHHVCNQDSAEIQPKRDSSLTLASLQTVAILVSYTFYDAELNPIQLLRNETPPLRSITPLQLTTALRI